MNIVESVACRNNGLPNRTTPPVGFASQDVSIGRLELSQNSALDELATEIRTLNVEPGESGRRSCCTVEHVPRRDQCTQLSSSGAKQQAECLCTTITRPMDPPPLTALVIASGSTI